MAGTGLGFRRVEGIGERSVSGALAGLLSLTSDAVLAFDGFGRILMANEAAERLFGRQDLVGADVRALFPPDFPFCFISKPPLFRVVMKQL